MNVEHRTSNDEVVFRRGGDPAAQTGAGFVHRRCSLTLEVQGTLSLTQPASGVAGPTKNKNLEYFHPSWALAPGLRVSTKIKGPVVIPAPWKSP